MTSKHSRFGLALGLLVAVLLLGLHPGSSAVCLDPFALMPYPQPVPIVNNPMATPMLAVAHPSMTILAPSLNTELSNLMAPIFRPTTRCSPMSASLIMYAVWMGDKFTPSPTYVMASWGVTGTCPEQFNAPVAAVVDNGRLYVVDMNNHRVKVSTTDGKTFCTFGSFGTGPGEFNLPRGIATYQGQVYVADTGNHRIQRFTADGEFVGICNIPGCTPTGITFDQTSGRMFVTDANINCVNSFTPIVFVVQPTRTRTKRAHTKGSNPILAANR